MLRLLCIDDYVAALRIRKTMLESRGCAVLTAENGVRALQILEQQAVDAVILDYRMEGMDGEAVAQAIKKKNPRLPIVLLTGFPREVPERLLAQVNAYVVKGEASARLLEAIERVTGKKLEHAGLAVPPEMARDKIEPSRTVKSSSRGRAGSK